MYRINLLTYKFKDQTIYRAAKIIGWSSLIFAIIRLILFFFGHTYFPVTLLRYFPFGVSILNKMEKDFLSGNMSLTLLKIFLFCWIGWQIVSAALVLAGVKYDKKNAFLPYIIQSIIEFVCQIVFFLYFMFSLLYVTNDRGEMIGSIQFGGQNTWLLPVMFSYSLIVDYLILAIIFVIRAHMLVSSKNKLSSSTPELE